MEASGLKELLELSGDVGYCQFVAKNRNKLAELAELGRKLELNCNQSTGRCLSSQRHSINTRIAAASITYG
jgi:hypothetical protein